MSKWRSRWSNFALNASIVFFGALVLILLFALATRSLAPRTDPVREETGGPLLGEIIQVEVLNGVGHSGIAATTTQFLKTKGFDVVGVDDFEHYNLEFSEVVDRIGDNASAIKVANALGIDRDRVREEIREDYRLDASVHLGNDYKKLRPFRNE